MQHDAVIWNVLSQHFCAFKVSLPNNQSTKFCRNKYNFSGLCNEKDCPLAHGRYATVIEENGVCYLYMKTVERAHTPANLWERVKLSKNFVEAIKQIDEHLIYWPEYMQNRVKVRLTRLRQVLIKMRKLKNKVQKEYVPVNQKERRRDDARQIRAEFAAEVDNKVKNEIVDRLKRKVYEQARLDQKHFDEALEEAKLHSDEEVDIYEEDEDEDDITNEREQVERYIADFEEDIENFSEEELEDETENGDRDGEEISSRKREIARDNRKGKRSKREIEYEIDNPQETTNFQTNW